MDQLQNQTNQEFYFKMKEEWGCKFTTIYNKIKNQKREISQIELQISIYKIYIELDIVPRKFEIKCAFIYHHFKRPLLAFEKSMFKKHYFITHSLLQEAKTCMYKYIDLLTNNFPESVSISALNHLNSYKSGLDIHLCMKYKKTHSFLTKKFKNNNFHTPGTNKGHQYINQVSDLQLVQSMPNTVKINKEGFVNKSDTIYNNNQIKLLNSGPKYSITTQVQTFDHQLFQADIEYIIRNVISVSCGTPVSSYLTNNLSQEQKLAVSNFKNQTLQMYPDHVSQFKKQMNLTEWNCINEIKKLNKNNNTIFVMADKANSLVAVSNDEYIKGVEQALIKNHFIKIKKSNHLTNHTKMKKHIHYLFSEKIIDFYTYKSIYPTSSEVCNIHGRYKLHKANGGYRPLVNTIPSYTSKPSKWLQKLLYKYSNSPYNIKNSNDFVQKLKKIKISQGAYMISLDIENMYGSVPVEEAIDKLVHRYRIDKCKPVKMKIADLAYFISLCTENITCRFNNQYYMQQTGLPMGGALSGLLADIYLSSIESKLLSKNGMIKGNSRKILAYFRYIDDVFLILSDKGYAGDILNMFNKADSNINFTMEEESMSKINYLDITIERLSSEFNFLTFRKESQNILKIPYKSLYQKHIKINIISQEINRAMLICNNERALSLELNNIRIIYINNGYPLQMINMLIEKIGSNYIKLLGNKTNFSNKGEFQNKSNLSVSESLVDYTHLTPNNPIFPIHTLKSNNEQIKSISSNNNEQSEINILENTTIKNFDLTFHPHPYPPPLFQYMNPRDSNKIFLKTENYQYFSLVKKVFNQFKLQNNSLFNYALDKIQIVSPSPPSLGTTLGDLYKNNNETSLFEKNNVVYSYKCVCDSVYYGSTTRSLGDRAREHLEYKNESAIFIHSELHSHETDYANFKVIIQNRNLNKLRVLESLFIVKDKPQLNSNSASELVIFQI